MKMTRVLLLIVLLSLPGILAAAQDRRPINFDDFMAMGRVGDPQISPDGQWVAYTVTRYDKAKNAGNSDIWLAPLAGGVPRQLTESDKRDSNARWSPDGKKIAFISSRAGGPQVWILDLPGGETRKLTSLSTGADGVLWSPDGKKLLFTSDIYPDCPDDACNKKRNEDADAGKVKAKIFDHLLYRQWNFWKDGKRTHIFIVPETGGQPRDLTPGDYDAPPFSLGGAGDYDFSPDGKEICFARNTDKVEATSTNSDLWIVPAGGGEARRITTNPAYDGTPGYSPDGKYIVYRAQKRPGFEADKFEIMIYDRAQGQSRSLTADLDRSAGDLSWAPDSQSIYFTCADEGYSSVYRVPVTGGKAARLTEKTTNDSVQITADGKSMVFVRQTMSRPAEIYRADADGKNARPITAVNEAALSRVEFGTVENWRYKGAAGASVQGWIIKPPQFVPEKKYPAVVLVHGGPQGAWGDSFSYRWNYHMFASRGYVVFAPNPRGSYGFGQKFTDEISGDWGGKVFEDIMNGVDFFTKLPYVDAARISAAGASYGGYMMNWLEGHTDRFRCLVSHDGVYNAVSMFGATEELWFPEWEFGGTPWASPDAYAKWSPSNFVKNFKTPLLVIHGELDYRVPVGEGFQLFTALQLMKVPSKFLYFPDEGHWVLKPQNSELWHKTVLDWIDQWSK